MASIVKSVEFIDINYRQSTVPVTVNLTKGQDEAKCVPFYKLEMNAALDDDFRDRMVKVSIIDNGGTAAVKIEGAGLINDLLCTLRGYVIEFEAAINVQQHVANGLTNLLTTANVAITDVGSQSSAFFMYSHDFDHTGAVEAPNRACVRAKWNGASTTSITIERNSNDGDITGFLYVVDCDAVEFVVDHQEISSISTDEDTDTTISATVLAKSFIIHSYTSAEAGDDPNDASFIARLDSTTNINIRRSITDDLNGSNAEHQVQVIEAQNDEFAVQRGNLVWVATPQTVAITAVTQANSMVKTGTHYSSPYDMGTSDTGTGNSVDALSTTVEFNSNIEISFERANDNETGNVIPWEVVDFTSAVAGISIPVVMHHRKMLGMS